MRPTPTREEHALFETWSIAVLLVVGLVAGIAGGMLGIGGSVVMIPALAFVFRGRTWDDQHLFQAAAMIVNVVVALPAAVRHKRAGAVPWGFVRIFGIATLIAIGLGVWASNQLDNRPLRLIFAAFLVYVVAHTLYKLTKGEAEFAPEGERVTVPRAGSVGLVTGASAGLLGIGGGIVSVPLAHTLCRLPLKQCIAASAVVMVVSSTVGSVMKLATLGQHGFKWTDAVLMALALAPTALLGGWIGAGLTHRSSLRTLRLVFCALLVVMAGRMAGLY